MVGGIEAVPFGLLTFVLGGLLIANAWAVVDAKLATDAAAREAVRAFVESDDPTTAITLAEQAARRTLDGFGRDSDRARIRPLGRPALTRCERVTIEVAYTVPALTLPLIGGFGRTPFAVSSRHTEFVDPFRNGLDGHAEVCL